VTTRKRSAAQTLIEEFPVASVVHLMAAVALCIVFVGNNGNLPDDSAGFFAILVGGNSIFAVGRGLASRRPVPERGR
jgi:hypothetical protein